MLGEGVNQTKRNSNPTCVIHAILCSLKRERIMLLQEQEYEQAYILGTKFKTKIGKRIKKQRKEPAVHVEWT